MHSIRSLIHSTLPAGRNHVPLLALVLTLLLTGAAMAYEARKFGWNLVIYTLIGGLVVGMMLFEIMRRMSRVHAAARQLARELKASGEALRNSELRSRRLIEANILGVLFADFDGNVVEANDAFLRLVGYDSDDLKAGRINWIELTPPEQRPFDQHALAVVRRTGAHAAYEKDFIRKDGSRVPVLVGSAYMGGKREMAVSFVFDLTERRRAERRLEAQYAIAQALAEARSFREAGAQILRAVGHNLGWEFGAIWHMRGRELRCMEAWCDHRTEADEFLRMTREGIRYPGYGIPGRCWAEARTVWVHDILEMTGFPRHQTAAVAGLRSAVAFPIIVDGVPDAVIEYFSRQIREPDEDLLEMFTAIANQIAQFIRRHRAEKALRFLAEASAILGSSLEYETTLRNVAQLAVPAIADCCTVDIVADDGAIERLAAVHLEDGKIQWARDCRKCCCPEPACPSGIANVIRTGEAELYRRVDEHTISMLTRDEEHAQSLRQRGLASMMIVPLASRGRTLGAMSFQSFEAPRRYGPEDLAHAQEVARRAAVAVDNARLFREAQQANHMKDEFLATVSHELRTPLNAMLGWAQLLAGGNLDPATTAEAVQAIARNAQTQARLVEDLLDLSRIIRGKIQMEMRPIELAVVIELAMAAVQPAVAAKQIELRRRIATDVPPVMGDASRLQQVVCNILNNAVKFTPAGGHVDISLEAGGSDVRITVADSGRGIRPEFLPHIFDRFRQADGSTTRQHGGLGLGLAIVHHLVELHGGTVTAQSEGEGKGAAFTIDLPAAPPGVASSAAMDATVASIEASDELTGLRVLVVDDEPDARRLLMAVLERAGARVAVADSAQQALAVMDRFNPDVLLSDIGMPGEDGYELIRKVRRKGAESGRQIPAAALTAFARSEDRTHAMAAGFQMHVPKPVDPSELLAVVKALARRVPQT